MGRFQLLKLQKFNSTRPERIISEILKRNRIKFRAKVKFAGREVDFLVKEKFVIEIGNHPQDPEKNKMLLEAGYHLQQLTNQEIISQDRIKLNKYLLLWLQA